MCMVLVVTVWCKHTSSTGVAGMGVPATVVLIALIIFHVRSAYNDRSPWNIFKSDFPTQTAKQQNKPRSDFKLYPPDLMVIVFA